MILTQAGQPQRYPQQRHAIGRSVLRLSEGGTGGKAIGNELPGRQQQRQRPEKHQPIVWRSQHPKRNPKEGGDRPDRDRQHARLFIKQMSGRDVEQEQTQGIQQHCRYANRQRRADPDGPPANARRERHHERMVKIAPGQMTAI